MLADCLRDEGLSVVYQPPAEVRGASGMGAPELIAISVLGGAGAKLGADVIKAAVKAAVDKFHDKSDGKLRGVEVVIEGEPDTSAEK
jgi:DhnA family fructose-bisphosphate aldolase class Ia